MVTLIQVSARVAGQVIKVNVELNQYVQAGTLIAEIDPKDFEVTVQQDEASLDSAEANYEAAKVNVPVDRREHRQRPAVGGDGVQTSDATVQQASRQLEAAQAQVAQATPTTSKRSSTCSDIRRWWKRTLSPNSNSTPSVATADAAPRAVLEAKANEIAAEDAVTIAKDKVMQSQAEFRHCANRARSGEDSESQGRPGRRRRWSRRAPSWPGQTESRLHQNRGAGERHHHQEEPRSAQNVSVGQNLMTLVSLDDIWITANFKETQLRRCVRGRRCKIHVDAYGRDYDGKVTQIGGATGSMLSLFPPENATGNFVKVVQRVPVRIDLTNRNEDRDRLLRPGLSVEPTVRVKD